MDRAKDNLPERSLCVAPMMDWTDRHCRYFHRLLAPSAWLYTEMVTTGAVLHGDRERLLAFNEEEHPVALQLGGSESADLARTATIGEGFGYDEINLNVGCPSDRVQKGRFGACLMLEPELVRDCLAAMRDAVEIPVTVKTRLGVDDHYSYEFFRDFVGTVMESGCTTLIAHARKALLSGLSPKENREIPPLHHDWVYRLKTELPDLQVVINGGIDGVESAGEHLEHVDGVMLGRAAYQSPWVLAGCQDAFCGGGAPDGREAVVSAYSDYLARQVEAGVPVKHMTRHVLGLFQGRPGAKIWRRYISQHAHLDDRNHGILLQALDAMRAAVPDAA
ncbi:MAG: tRNA dihydrouridine(20/20a) synthase DusA [Xanthomonadales bacterium]|nr:tRNA dihydrouridine(20/20a) synthase DusA [Xanthomonadales bacterium]NIX12714.1 tRNA dihydrouridine(20/20a) synthase DusA [Xanthomonadales bacterium]